MPTYVYQAVDAEKGCDHCSSSFEKIERITVDPTESCPECGADIERVVRPDSVKVSVIDSSPTPDSSTPGGPKTKGGDGRQPKRPGAPGGLPGGLGGGQRKQGSKKGGGILS